MKGLQAGSSVTWCQSALLLIVHVRVAAAELLAYPTVQTQATEKPTPEVSTQQGIVDERQPLSATMTFDGHDHELASRSKSQLHEEESAADRRNTKELRALPLTTITPLATSSSSQPLDQTSNPLLRSLKQARTTGQSKWERLAAVVDSGAAENVGFAERAKSESATTVRGNSRFA